MYFEMDSKNHCKDLETRYVNLEDHDSEANTAFFGDDDISQGEFAMKPKEDLEQTSTFTLDGFRSIMSEDNLQVHVVQ